MTVETFAELAGQPAWMIRCLLADGTLRRPLTAEQIPAAHPPADVDEGDGSEVGVIAREVVVDDRGRVGVRISPGTLCRRRRKSNSTYPAVGVDTTV